MADRLEQQQNSAVIQYRDREMVLRNVSDRDRRHLLRAGFHPNRLTLARDAGGELVGTLWTQEEPSVPDYLNAATLLFGDEPGSLSW